jgi:hypothetical protein
MRLEKKVRESMFVCCDDEVVKMKVGNIDRIGIQISHGIHSKMRSFKHFS